MFLSKPIQQMRVIGSLVKFSHTIFALPFALSMFIIVSKDHGVRFDQLVWILLCLVSARTAAMGWNRYLDRSIDAKNPRTQTRELPTGKISSLSVLFLVSFSAALFFFGSYLLGTHCLVLAPLVLGLLFFYSWTKRFTSLAHVVLGLALALAPGGVWYALTAEISYKPVLMMLAVLFWVAGFDILYSCQDSEFDRQEGLHSIPAKLGVENAFLLSRLSHMLSIIFLYFTGVAFELGVFYFLGVGIFCIFLFAQHAMLRVDDLSKIDAAFFNRNAQASFLYFICTSLDVLL